jgi:hypothetical protein
MMGFLDEITKAAGSQFLGGESQKGLLEQGLSLLKQKFSV